MNELTDHDKEVVEKAKTLVDRIASIVAPVVAMVEAKPQTTSHNYGDYLVLIPKMVDGLSENQKLGPEHKDGLYLALAAALVKAGADKKGVYAAMTILGKL